MTAIANPIDLRPTLAERQAADYWAANVSALNTTQQGLAESLPPISGHWSFVFGRDGALTVMDRQQKWWQGCSLPRRTAVALLRTLSPTGRVSCYLSPTQAAQIRVAIDKLPADHAIIVLCPDLSLISVMLRCDDFARDIAANRLFFVGGLNWPEDFRRLYDRFPGLPTPEQFIRNNSADLETVNSLMPIAEKVFAEQSANRSARIQSAKENWTPARSATPSICLLARSQFYLWDDGGQTLANAFESSGETLCQIHWIDTDRPTSAAPVMLAEAAQKCDAIVSVNIARADLPELVSKDLPWITWLTREAIPVCPAGVSNDLLLVTHESARQQAIKLGWPGNAVRLAAWPTRAIPVRNGGTGGNASLYLAIIADTWSIDPPAHVKDLSSQLLLWEAIANDIANDPFAPGGNPNAYLARQQRSLRIPDDGFDSNLFCNRLILPATLQSLARWMLAQGLPLRLFGEGWDKLSDLQAASAGKISTRDQFDQAIAGAFALVHAWPGVASHPIESVDRPLLRSSFGKQAFLQSVSAAALGRLAPPSPVQSPLDLRSIIQAVA